MNANAHMTYPRLLFLCISLALSAAPLPSPALTESAYTATGSAPGFDIVSVKILCKDSDGTYSNTRFQPLVSDDAGVEARLGNMLAAPSNIQMYVTYYVGTNVWGVDNWPTGQTVTKPMYPTTSDPLAYRTSPTNDIPVQELNQVVQYHVWATYLDGIQVLKQQETFNIPPWYDPVDFNQTFADQGWSPYYVVYGVPVGAVWINEVNATDYVISNDVRVLSIADNPYIEIAVPGGLDLAGWKIDLVNSDGLTQTIQIPDGLPPQEATTNGYAFFVIGEHPANNQSYVPPLPKLDYACPYFSTMIPSISPGGLRLRRPMGMIEQAIAYDYEPRWALPYSGTNWVAQNPQLRLVYVGQEMNGGSLCVTNGSGTLASDWGFPLTWTPGQANQGQAVPAAVAVIPGVTNVTVTSLTSMAQATQNGLRTLEYSLKVRQGASTNVIYTADDWYRISSVQMNQVEQLAPGSALRTYTLGLVDVQSNITVAVTLGLRPDIAGLVQSPAVLNWLFGFADAPLVTNFYNGRELAMTELFWLNADPTVSNHLEYTATRFNVDSGGNLHATVRLALNDQNVMNLLGSSVMKVEVKNTLADAQWQLLEQYSLSSASFDMNHTSRFTLANPFQYMLSGWDSGHLYCRVVIDLEDSRLLVRTLVTEPEE